MFPSLSSHVGPSRSDCQMQSYGLTQTEPTTQRTSDALYQLNRLEDTQRWQKGEGRNAHVGRGEATSDGSSLRLNWIKHLVNLHPGFSFQATLSHHCLQRPPQRPLHEGCTTAHHHLQPFCSLRVARNGFLHISPASS